MTRFIVVSFIQRQVSFVATREYKVVDKEVPLRQGNGLMLVRGLKNWDVIHDSSSSVAC
jgi:hypothetical protein